jgi:hypothetical protein
MNANLQTLISRQFNPNETLVYQSQPDAARAQARGWWAVPIGFLMVSFALVPMVLSAAMRGLIRAPFLSNAWLQLQGWLLEVTGDVNLVNGLQEILTLTPRAGFGATSWLVLGPFVLVLLLVFAFGFWIMMSPQRLAKAAKNTVYLVTNKRAIIIEPSWRAFQVSSYTKNQLEKIERIERADGSGSLYFASDWQQSTEHHTSQATVHHHGASTQHATVHSSGPTFRRVKIGFEDILDVRSAEHALMAIQ